MASSLANTSQENRALPQSFSRLPQGQLAAPTAPREEQLMLFGRGEDESLVLPRLPERTAVKRIVSATLIEEPTTSAEKRYGIDFRIHDPKGEEVAKVVIGPGGEASVRALFEELDFLMQVSEAPRSATPILGTTVAPEHLRRMLEAIEASELETKSNFGANVKEMLQEYQYKLAAFAARDIARTLRIDVKQGRADLADGIEHVNARDESQLLWVDVRQWEPILTDYLVDRFGLDRRAIDQCAKTALASELLGFGEQLFLRTTVQEIDPHDPQQVKRHEIRIFAGRNFLVTWHEGECEALRMLQEELMRRASRPAGQGPQNSLHIMAEVLALIARANALQLEQLRSSLEADQRAMRPEQLDASIVNRSSEARAIAQAMEADAKGISDYLERARKTAPLFRELRAEGKELDNCPFENAMGSLAQLGQKAGEVIKRANEIRADYNTMVQQNTQQASFSISRASWTVALGLAGIQMVKIVSPGLLDSVSQAIGGNPWFSIAGISLTAAGLMHLWRSAGPEARRGALRSSAKGVGGL